jgi:mannose-1-phosphate guanylyltransferase/phosphomannomutase
MTNAAGGLNMRSKARLTITLPRQLLVQVDDLVDGQTIRNRSHAIELLIRRSMKPAINTAVILTGGPANSGDTPALTPINGQRLIFITLNHLAQYGIREFVLLAGKYQGAIQEAVGDGRDLGLQIHFVPESRPLGTAGALKLAEDRLADHPFLVVHGDILTDINLSDFINFHEQEGRLATIAVKPRSAEREYGQVMLQGNRITDFFADGQEQGVSVINTGIYLMSPKVLSLIDGSGPVKLETEIFPKLANMGELNAFFFQGMWFDISSQERLRLARERWRQQREPG